METLFHLDEHVNATPPSEVETGQRWLGKVIFRRFFKGTSGTAGSSTSMTTDGSVKYIIDARGWIQSSDGRRWPITHSNVDANTARFLIWRETDNNIVFFVGGGTYFASLPYEIAVDYIKAT